MYGRRWTEEERKRFGDMHRGVKQTREAIEKRLKSRGHIITRHIAVECDGMKFATIKEFSDYYNIHPCNAAKWHTGKKKIPQKWRNLNIKFIEY